MTRIPIIVALFAAVTPSLAAQQDDEQLQGRYRLCMDKADSDSLEEFRSFCDVIRITAFDMNTAEPWRAAQEITIQQAKELG